MEDDVKGKGLTGICILMLLYIFLGIPIKDISLFGVEFRDIEEWKILTIWIASYVFFTWRYMQHYLVSIDDLYEKFALLNRDKYYDYVTKNDNAVRIQVKTSDSMNYSKKSRSFHYVLGNIQLKKLPGFTSLFLKFMFLRREYMNLYIPLFLAIITGLLTTVTIVIAIFK